MKTAKNIFTGIVIGAFILIAPGLALALVLYLSLTRSLEKYLEKESDHANKM